MYRAVSAEEKGTEGQAGADTGTYFPPVVLRYCTSGLQVRGKSCFKGVFPRLRKGSAGGDHL